jgi:hypothetical protein
LTANCAVCDTINRQQQSNNRLSLFENNDQTKDIDDYEHISFPGQMIARAFVRGYEENSMNSSSHRSITIADEDSIRPMEYYRQ